MLLILIHNIFHFINYDIYIIIFTCLADVYVLDIQFFFFCDDQISDLFKTTFTSLSIATYTTCLIMYCVTSLKFRNRKNTGQAKSYCLHFCKLYNKHKRQVYMYLFVVYIFDSNKSKVYLKILMFKIMHAYCLIIQFLQ